MGLRSNAFLVFPALADMSEKILKSLVLVLLRSVWRYYQAIHAPLNRCLQIGWSSACGDNFVLALITKLTYIEAFRSFDF